MFNPTHSLWQRIVLTVVALTVVPVVALGEQVQRMAVIGGTQVVVAGKAAKMPAYCVDFKRVAPRDGDTLEAYLGDVIVEVWDAKLNDWVKSGSLKMAIKDQVLTVNGISVTDRSTGEVVGRFDSLRIAPGAKWDGVTMYKVKVEGGALFGANGKDLKTAAEATKVLGKLDTYFKAHPALGRRAMQETYWVLEQSGKATEAEADRLVQLSPKDFLLEVAELARKLNK
jgi:hypothetical protein